MKLSDHIDGFIAAKGYTKKSEKQRRMALRMFILATGDPTPADLNPSLVLKWWGAIADREGETRRNYLSAVRAFITHLQALGEMQSDPSAIIRTPKAVVKPPVVLGAAEAGRVMAAAETVRERCLVALMLGCALRAGDAARVDIDRIDTVGWTLAVMGKGNKWRVLPVPSVVRPYLLAQIEMRGVESGPLVVDRSGRRINETRCAQSVTEVLLRAGVKRGAYDMRSSHVLRRTCATFLLENGATIVEVQAILGHASLASTQRYLAVRDATALMGLVDTAAGVWELPEAA